MWGTDFMAYFIFSSKSFATIIPRTSPFSARFCFIHPTYAEIWPNVERSATPAFSSITTKLLAMSFARLLGDINKTTIMEQPPDVELPEELESDRELVLAVMACDSEKMLVTTDGDLINLLREASITTKYNIEPIQPENVMEKMGYTQLGQQE